MDLWGEEFDAVVVGAGFSGLYAVHRLTRDGLRVRGYDEAGDVGGTWWWTRYPGARVDVPGGPYYCYTFSEEVVEEWTWTETQPSQTEVLRYLEFVADRFNLRDHYEFQTRVVSAVFDEPTSKWHLTLSSDKRVVASFLVSAVGTLSAQSPNIPAIDGLDSFEGDVLHTGHWPRDEIVDFAGKKVGMIGTGSSGVQLAPAVAAAAEELYIFQRTPQYSFPAGNRPVDDETTRWVKQNWRSIRERMYAHPRGRGYEVAVRNAADESEEERRKTFEENWVKGGMAFLESYSDLLIDAGSNESVCEFVREKITSIVNDRTVAEQLLPYYHFAAKRPIMDQGYYEIFNSAHVHLTNIADEPISRITPCGIETGTQRIDLDVIIFATGYDAITGGLTSLNPVGVGGVSLKDKWREGISSFLGVTIAGFPNLFVIHGPYSPSVLAHMPLGSERQSDWIADCISFLRANAYSAIEASEANEEAWVERVGVVADRTLLPKVDSWYTGANIPGKPRRFLVHLAGDEFYASLTAETARGFPSFSLRRDGDASSKVAEMWSVDHVGR